MEKLKEWTVDLNIKDFDEVKQMIEELDYLRYFYEMRDFGSADIEVREAIANSYRLETGKCTPEGY